MPDADARRGQPEAFAASVRGVVRVACAAARLALPRLPAVGEKLVVLIVVAAEDDPHIGGRVLDAPAAHLRCDVGATRGAGVHVAARGVWRVDEDRPGTVTAAARPCNRGLDDAVP